MRGMGLPLLLRRQIKFFGASGHIPLVVALLAAAILGALIVLVAGISRIISTPAFRSEALKAYEATFSFLGIRDATIRPETW